MAAGAGMYSVAVITTVLSLIALWPLRTLAYRMIDRVKPEEDRLTVELREGRSLGQLLEVVPGVRHIEVTEETDRRIVQIESPAIDEELVARVSDLDDVIGVKWRR
jgi:uncharacterized membrane protein YhiD involved in acid resistance